MPFDFSKGVPAVQAGLMISPNAFNDDKWVDEGVAKHGADKTGRKEFFAALATFVR